MLVAQTSCKWQAVYAYSSFMATEHHDTGADPAQLYQGPPCATACAIHMSFTVSVKIQQPCQVTPPESLISPMRRWNSRRFRSAAQGCTPGGWGGRGQCPAQEGLIPKPMLFRSLVRSEMLFSKLADFKGHFTILSI